VTLQLDFRNAFNSVSRTALLQAVASRAPRLLPFAPWTFRSHGPLVVLGAPADATPLTSQSRVRHGDPCGPLLFALALQGPLERVLDAFTDVRVVAYADDVHLQGPPEAAVEAFRLLVSTTAPIGLTPSLSKCAAYAQSAATGLAVASDLGIAHRPEGLVAAGTPLGSDAFVETDARSRAETVASLVTAIASLPLGKQDKFLLLRSSLQARLTHLTRITPWSRLSPHVAAAERQVLLAALDLVEHPPPAEMQSNPVVAQLALPLCSGGFGLRLTTPLEADAAFLAAAGAADVAMRPAPPIFRPFNPASPHCAALISRWVALHDVAPGLWSPELRALAAPLLAPVLMHSLHSCACRPASIWLDTMPTSFPLTLSDSDFASSASLRLGLPVGPANAPALWWDCGTTVLPGDFDQPLTCTCLALQRTSRHDFVTTSLRRIARVGFHTTAKLPFFHFFPTPSSPPADPSARPVLAPSSGGSAPDPPVPVLDTSALTPATALAPPGPRIATVIRAPLLALGRGGFDPFSALCMGFGHMFCLCFTFRGLDVCRVCAVALGFVSVWQADSFVSLQQKMYRWISP
jgi:hypothetical protein